MKKIFSFLAGALVGTLVGGATTLLLTPASGEDLRAQARSRWESAKAEARRAQSERQRELEAEFARATRS